MEFALCKVDYPHVHDTLKKSTKCILLEVSAAATVSIGYGMPLVKLCVKVLVLGDSWQQIACYFMIKSNYLKRNVCPRLSAGIRFREKLS